MSSSSYVRPVLLRRLDTTEVSDLFAAVLLSGTRHLLRLGLDQGYVEREEEIAGVRGRMNLDGTARKMLTQHGRSLCRYDELETDTLPNRILKSTVAVLARTPQLDRSLRRQLDGLTRELGGVREIVIRDEDFRLVQHHKNRTYRFLLDVCRLVRDSMLVDEQSGGVRFRDLTRDDRRMSGLFEAFIFNFLSKERKDLDIQRDTIEWNLKNLEGRDGPDGFADGMLLYPVVQEAIDLRYEVPRHSIRVRTIDLSADWREIRTELLQLLDT